MAMAQTAFRTRRTLNRSRMATANKMQRAEIPLFQAFLRLSSAKVTDGLCIKDSTTIDPACGSGNFLTETYISLRRLENEAIKMRQEGGQIEFDTGEIIKVSIGQFYGIEINDFAVSVAKTALWIAESQMMHETEEIVSRNLEFLPLKSYANIMEETLCVSLGRMLSLKMKLILLWVIHRLWVKKSSLKDKSKI